MRNTQILLLALAITLLGVAACTDSGPSGTTTDLTQSSRLSIMDSGGGGGGGGY